MRPRVALSDERGETLLELVIAILILGVCVVGIGSGIALSVKVSGIHRDQSTAGAFLHNYAEALQGTSAYAACTSSSTPNYVSNLALAPPSGFQTPTATVNYWNSSTSAFGTSINCPAAGDPGLQKVTLTLTSSDGFVTESLVVVIRDSS